MTLYPSGIDTDAQLPRLDDNVSEIGADAMNAMREAIIAIQRAIGENPQGATASLVNRISASINDDGTLKSSALLAAGLVALPITNAQISASAAIEEAKLDLDVATQSLQNQVSSNDIDIANLQKSISQIINDFVLHITGAASKHDSFDILLDSNYPSSTPPSFASLTAADVGNAIIEMNDRFIDHASSGKESAHSAKNIAVDGSGFISIPTSVSDAQSAIEELDRARDTELIRHRDHMHANGFDNWANSVDGYNPKNQIVPSTFGATTQAQTFSALPNKLRFDGTVLANLGVKQGDVVVISDANAGGIYLIDDVGPRPAGVRPLLTSEELELTSPISNITLVTSNTVSAQIFGSSSVFTFKTNVAPTFRQSSTMDSVQIARPNAAKVLSLGLRPELIDGTEVLDLTVGLDTGTRSISISDLNENRVGPVATVTIDTIVDKINSVLHGASNFPASAYKVGDELMLAHNWDGYAGYYIQVDGSGSGYTKLGLDGYGAGVVDLKIYPTQSSALYVNGLRHTSTKILFAGAGSAAASSISFSGVNPIDLGIVPGHIVHVKNHATQDDNGTYFITGVSSNSITLHTTIGTSSVDVEIIHDTVPLVPLAGSGKTQLIETFLDKDARLGFNVRLEYDNSIPNLNVIDISDNTVPASYKLISQATAGGHNLFVDIGVVTFVPTGFIGTKTVYLPSNIEAFVVDITGPLGVSPFGGADILINQHIDEEEVLEIASVRSNGSFTLFDVVDKRLFGSIGLDELREDVVQAYVETPATELRSDGVVRGFDLVPTGGPFDGYFLDFVFPDNGSLLLRGGTAYIDGVRNDVRTQTVTFPVPLASTTFVVCLNKLGNYELVDVSDFTLQQILDGQAGQLLPIVQVDHDGSTGPYPLSAPVDLRRFINSLDEKIDLIVDSTNNMIGAFATVSAALAYANSYPQGEKFLLRIVSNDPSNDIVIPSTSRDISIEIDGVVGSVTANAPVKISGRGVGNRSTSHISGTLTVTNLCDHFELSNVVVDGSILIDGAADSKTYISGSTIKGTVTITSGGDLVSVINTTFASSSGGIVDNSTFTLNVSGCSFNGGGISKTDGVAAFIHGTVFADPLASPYSGFVNVSITDCQFGNTQPITASKGNITGSVFNSMTSKALQLYGDFVISDCIFDTSTNEIIDGYDASVLSCYFTNTTSNTNNPLVFARMIKGCFVDSSTLSGVPGNFVVRGEVVEDNENISQVNGVFSPGLHKVVGNKFLSSDNLGQQIIAGHTSSSFDLVQISENKFVLGDGQDGILLGEDTATSTSKNIIIRDNLFVPNTGKAPSVAINLFKTGSVAVDGSVDKNIKIISNIFSGVAGLSNDVAIRGLILSENTFTGLSSSFVINIGDNCIVAYNKFSDSAGAQLNGNPQNLAVISNVIDNAGTGLQIGTAPMSNILISSNVGPVTIGGGVTECVISENIGSFSVSSPVNFTKMIFTNNSLDVGASFASAIWQESIINNNVFIGTAGLTITLEGTVGQCAISGNVFNLTGTLALDSSGSILKSLFADNFSVGSINTLNIQKTLNNSFINRNFNFEITVNGANGSSISSNLMPSSDLILAQTVNNTDVSSNTVNSIIFSGTQITNFIVQNNQIFGTISLSDTVASGANLTSSKTISNCVVSGNYLHSGNINIGNGENIGAGVTFEASSNNISNNKLALGSINVFQFGTVDSTASFEWSGNVVSGNTIIGLNLFGSVIYRNTDVFLNTLISSNTISGNVNIATDYQSAATLTGLEFSSNYIGGAFSYTNMLYSSLNINSNIFDSSFLVDLDMSSYDGHLNLSITDNRFSTDVNINGGGAGIITSSSGILISGNNCQSAPGVYTDINITPRAAASSAWYITNITVSSNILKTLSFADDRTVNYKGNISQGAILDNKFLGNGSGIKFESSNSTGSGDFSVQGTTIAGNIGDDPLSNTSSLFLKVDNNAANSDLQFTDCSFTGNSRISLYGDTVRTGGQGAIRIDDSSFNNNTEMRIITTNGSVGFSFENCTFASNLIPFVVDIDNVGFLSCTWVGNSIYDVTDPSSVSITMSLNGGIFSQNVVGASLTINSGYTGEITSNKFWGNLRITGAFDGSFASNRIRALFVTTYAAQFDSLFKGEFANNYIVALDNGSINDPGPTVGVEFQGSFQGIFDGNVVNGESNFLGTTVIGILSNNYFWGTTTLNPSSTFSGLVGSISGNYWHDGSLVFNQAAIADTVTGQRQVKIIGNSLAGTIDTLAPYDNTTDSGVFFWGNTANGTATNLTIGGTTARTVANSNRLGGPINVW